VARAAARRALSCGAWAVVGEGWAALPWPPRVGAVQQLSWLGDASQQHSLPHSSFASSCKACPSDAPAPPRRAKAQRRRAS